MGHRVHQEVVPDWGDGAGRFPVEGEVNRGETHSQGP